MNPEFGLVALVLGTLSIVSIATVTITAIVFNKDQTALKALDVFKSLFRYLPRINFPQGGEDSEPHEDDGSQ